MSASHDRHAHTCCHASTKHGPDTAAGETTHATDVGAAAGTSSNPMDEHAHGQRSQGSHEINQAPGAGSDRSSLRHERESRLPASSDP